MNNHCICHDSEKDGPFLLNRLSMEIYTKGFVILQIFRKTERENENVNDIFSN